MVACSLTPCFCMASEPRRRPALSAALLSLFIDAMLAVASYLLAYRVRFDASTHAIFVPGAERSLPLAVGCQMAALLMAGVYWTRLRTLWPRVLGAVTIGTAAGAFATSQLLGFTGVSRLAFAIDALLLAFTTFTWRGASMLVEIARRSRATDARALAMEDRADLVSRAGHGLSGLVRYRQLLKNLVMKDLKLKYRGSVFGFLWSLLNPLMMLVVYTVAFTYILRAAEPGFVFRVLIGLLAWGFFANSATMSTGSVIDNRGMIKNVFFPRTILPVATVLFNLAQFLLNIVVFVPLMLLIFGVPPSPAVLGFPIFLALNVAFMIGLALLISTATAFFRDIRHLLEVGLSMLFWTTPIIFSYQQLPDSIRA